MMWRTKGGAGYSLKNDKLPSSLLEKQCDNKHTHSMYIRIIYNTSICARVCVLAVVMANSLHNITDIKIHQICANNYCV